MFIDTVMLTIVVLTTVAINHAIGLSDIAISIGAAMAAGMYVLFQLHAGKRK